MTNQQLIKYAHIWFLGVLLACGVGVAASKAGIRMQSQNSNNQNGNANGNSNTNTNTNTNANTQNRNDNRSGNRNTGTTGGQAGMGNLTSQDRKFVMETAMAGMVEVELGRVAAQRGGSDAVKQFGQRMVDDHSKANEELTSLASGKGITLPTALDQKHQQHVTKLSGLSGAEFDRAYMRMMVSEHDDAVKDFEKQSTRGSDADLKAFAGKTLPTLQEHLQMARDLNASQGGNSNSGGGRSTNRNSNGNSNGNSNRP